MVVTHFRGFWIYFVSKCMSNVKCVYKDECQGDLPHLYDLNEKRERKSDRRAGSWES